MIPNPTIISSSKSFSKKFPESIQGILKRQRILIDSVAKRWINQTQESLATVVLGEWWSSLL